MSGIRSESRQNARVIRKGRVRKKVIGTDTQPRLCVFRSLKYTYAQLVSDESGSTLVALSTRQLAAEGKSAKCKDSAKLLGTKIAELMKAKSISKCVFDRSGYIFHGRIAAICDGLREGGIQV